MLLNDHRQEDTEIPGRCLKLPLLCSCLSTIILTLRIIAIVFMKEHTVHAHGLAIRDKKLGHTGKGDKSGELEVV